MKSSTQRKGKGEHTTEHTNDSDVNAFLMLLIVAVCQMTKQEEQHSTQIGGQEYTS